MAEDDKSKQNDEKDESKTSDKDEDGKDFKAEAEKWKNLARKHEQRAKDNADKAQKFDQLEDEKKSESQKSADRIAELEAELKGEKGKTARLSVALRKGLTEVQAKRLVGDTEEDLEKDADELLESFGGSKKDDTEKDDKDSKETRSTKERPKEKLRPGATPSGDEDDEMDPKKLADAVSSTAF